MVKIEGSIFNLIFFFILFWKIKSNFSIQLPQSPPLNGSSSSSRSSKMTPRLSCIHQNRRLCQPLHLVSYHQAQLFLIQHHNAIMLPSLLIHSVSLINSLLLLIQISLKIILPYKISYHTLTVSFFFKI